MSIPPALSYVCDCCTSPITAHRVRIHCLICPDYDSCADCHVLERVTAPHVLSHKSRIVRPLVEKKTFATNNGSLPTLAAASSSAAAALSFEGGGADEEKEVAYWGNFEDPHSTFTRLLEAIYAHIINSRTDEMGTTDGLEPEKFCIVLHAMGYTTGDLSSLVEEGSLEDDGGQQRRVWLSDLGKVDEIVKAIYQRRGLEYRLVSGLRGRGKRRISGADDDDQNDDDDEETSDSSPVLSETGFHMFIVQQIQLDPSDAYTRLNKLLHALWPLTDRLTNTEFLHQQLPRACFPPLPDPDMQQQQLKRKAAQEQAQELSQVEVEEELAAQRIAQQMAADDYRFMWGGWKIDEFGNRRYQQGLYE